MIGQSISEMIRNGFNRNIVVYDKESVKLSLRLFALKLLWIANPDLFNWVKDLKERYGLPYVYGDEI